MEGTKGLAMNKELAKKLVAFARKVASEEASWADWNNRVFGHEGEFVKLFPDEESRKAFFESPFADEIKGMEQSLRRGQTATDYTRPITTPSGKFVVRIPTSLHAALASEARSEGVSLNQLILTKLAISLREFTERIEPNVALNT